MKSEHILARLLIIFGGNHWREEIEIMQLSSNFSELNENEMQLTEGGSPGGIAVIIFCGLCFVGGCINGYNS